VATTFLATTQCIGRRGAGLKLRTNVTAALARFAYSEPLTTGRFHARDRAKAAPIVRRDDQQPTDSRRVDDGAAAPHPYPRATPTGRYLGVSQQIDSSTAET